MRYQGGKTRIASHIARYINAVSRRQGPDSSKAVSAHATPPMRSIR